MRKLGVKEWLVSAVTSMHTGAKTVVRTVYGNSNGSEVKVGMHQGSVLTHTQPFYCSLDFVWGNPGEPVLEETFTHSIKSFNGHVCSVCGRGIGNNPIHCTLIINLAASVL